MPWLSRCSTCKRPATLIITGRHPGKTLYTALSCDPCAPRHRKKAREAGPVTEKPHQQTEQQPTLF